MLGGPGWRTDPLPRWGSCRPYRKGITHTLTRTPMPMSVAVSSRMRCALLLAALVAPAAALAQGRADARGEQVVVTTAAVRIRTAPSMISLSTDEYGAGTQFRLAPEDYQSKDWFAIEYDGRVLYVPRNAAVLKSRAGFVRN